MITITLEPQYEKLCPDDTERLYHQQRTYEALRSNDLVINAYNTGTGKTRASLLYLKDLNDTNVLFIAPTNELIRQHVSDIEKFVKKNHLNFHVIEVNASLLNELGLDPKTSRNGENLHRLVKNPLTFAKQLKLDTSGYTRKSLIMVVNPDIFYYGMYFFYKPTDQRNVFEAFLTEFNYIVIDEFHYYNIKQLANFLFFFIICKEFGYFDGSRKICLLSATPNMQLEEFLSRLNLKYTILHPENEPPESNKYPKTQSLGEVELQMSISDNLEDLIREQADSILKYVHDDKLDGAIISSALWKINNINQLLANIPEKGRITGAGTRDSRQTAKYKPLILATPTVDIGYNFEKHNKDRQNIDFIFFDGYFQDEFLQRLGRVGRTLGKSVLNQTSYAFAVTDPAVVKALQDKGQERYDRKDFVKLLQELGEKFPQKNELQAYISSYAITEAFYPIYNLTKVMPPYLQNLPQRLFDRVKEVFAPKSRRQFWVMRKEILNYDMKKRIALRYEKQHTLAAENKDEERLLKEALSLYVQENTEEAISPSLLEQLYDVMPTNAELQKKLGMFLKRKYLLTEALFNFRSSFQGPTTIVFDPKHLLSENNVATYDLFHLILHYQYKRHEKKQFKRLVKSDVGKSDFYLELTDFEKGRQLAFKYETNLPKDQFEWQYCNKPTIINPLGIVVFQNQAIIPIELDIQTSLREIYVPCLIVKREDRGRLYLLLRKKSLFRRKVFVQFDDSTYTEYDTVFGTDAFFVHAELRGYFYGQSRKQSDECWIV